MTQKHYYTDERNAQIVIALLKAHGIRNIIANPGTTNIAFVGSVQNDPWFKVYSGVDERHSAYMAVGMAHESGDPVVLSCTGATASRNYFPALTEAYYRKLPILALTSIHRLGTLGNLLPQMLDRSVQPKDTVRYSVQIPTPHTKIEEEDCILNVNKALLELTRDGGGPVHINLETSRIPTFNTEVLPPVRVIKRVSPFDKDWPKLDPQKKIAIWIGAHRRFSDEETKAIETFVSKYNAVVCVDTTSSYCGAGSIKAALVSAQQGAFENPKYSGLLPDIEIQLGEISGDYFSMGYCNRAPTIWRVNSDGEVRDLAHKLSYIFAMPEDVFFNHYSDMISSCIVSGAKLFNDWEEADGNVRKQMPEFPFSNLWLVGAMHDKFPANSIVHFGIFISFRSGLQYYFPAGVETACNVGGFGIDGALSTLIGASLASPEKLVYGIVGDLAFFYDMNALGNKHIGKNVRILLVNNGCGAEFKLSSHYGSQFGDQTEDYIAAGHHFGDKSHELVKHFASDLGFKYFSASTKEQFLAVLPEFMSDKMEQSMVFECFTKPEDESIALEMLGAIDPYKSAKTVLKDAVKTVLPPKMVDILRDMFK